MWKVFIITDTGNKKLLGPPMTAANAGAWLATLRAQFPADKFGIVTV